jgi:hypothetical protein
VERLSGQDVRALSSKLSSTLDAETLASLVYASTGERLYDKFVPNNLPLIPTIEKLLNALEEDGLTPLFLSAVYEIRHVSRKDVATEILRVCPEAAAGASRNGVAIEVQATSKPLVAGRADLLDK